MVEKTYIRPDGGMNCMSFIQDMQGYDFHIPADKVTKFIHEVLLNEAKFEVVDVDEPRKGHPIEYVSINGWNPFSTQITRDIAEIDFPSRGNGDTDFVSCPSLPRFRRTAISKMTANLAVAGDRSSGKAKCYKVQAEITWPEPGVDAKTVKVSDSAYALPGLIWEGQEKRTRRRQWMNSSTLQTERGYGHARDEDAVEKI